MPVPLPYKYVKDDRFPFSTTLTTLHLQCADEDDRLDGRPPVILIQPALVMCRGAISDPRLADELIMKRGLALIEDRVAN